MVKILFTWLGLITVLALSGCGGGGGASFDDLSPGINVEVRNADSLETTEFIEGETVVFYIKVVDQDRSLVKNEQISVETTLGIIQSNTPTTDLLGGVELQLVLPTGLTTPSEGEVTIIYSGYTKVIEFSVSPESFDSTISTGLNVTIKNASTEVVSNSLLETEDGLVEITFIGEDGLPSANQIVNVDVTVGDALVSQGSVLTDSSGEAQLFLFSPDVTAGSQPGSLVATSGDVTSDAVNFEFKANNVVDPDTVVTGIVLKMTIASSGQASNSIIIDETANLEITLFDDDGNPMAGEIVNLTASSGLLSQDSVLTNAEGIANVTIDPPTDLTFGTAPGVISASSTATTKSSQFNYEFVATTQTADGDPAVATSIRFESVSQEIISLKGTGTVGFGESSEVNFTVLNGSTTVSNAEVTFVLTTTVGGITFDGGGTLTTATSDAQGRVSVIVHSGNVATPVRVTAFIELESGDTIFVQSNILTITTGIPDQNSISLSLSKFTSEGNNFDGDTIEVTARLGDRFNNPVPVGTRVNFTTEGGNIVGSCLTNEFNQCSVSWESQNPRPADGRTTIMAHAIGHETYFDENGTGVFDGNGTDGDEFEDLPEAFRDDDENGVFDPDAYDGFVNNFSRDEIFVDYDASASYSLGDGVFNGVPCNHDTDCPIDANNLAGRSNSLIDVRAEGLIIMANSSASVDVRLIEAGANSCLDGNGKYLTDGTCSSVSSIIFPTGANTVKLWALVEDGRALCKNALLGDRVDSVNPNDPLCAYAVRQSAATGSAITVTAAAGELSDIPVSSVPNQYGALEFIIYLSSSAENEDDESGAFLLKVDSPLTNTPSSYSISVTDPAN